ILGTKRISIVRTKILDSYFVASSMTGLGCKTSIERHLSITKVCTSPNQYEKSSSNLLPLELLDLTSK
ncbi:hypothetical protein, partial [Vibrio breoganii]|uniref:hypothetical protein n=1 Tax=Vibrio breoganii TaxID=553239 RepID=UPI001A7E056B